MILIQNCIERANFLSPTFHADGSYVIYRADKLLAERVPTDLRETGERILLAGHCSAEWRTDRDATTVAILRDGRRQQTNGVFDLHRRRQGPPVVTEIALLGRSTIIKMGIGSRKNIHF